jgi:hypothetical protein
MKHLKLFENFLNEWDSTHTLKWHVDLSGDFIDSEKHEKHATSNWKIEMEPITVVSVEGNIDDEHTNLDIKLSNGDELSLEAFYHIGPPEQYSHKKDFAKLSVEKANGKRFSIDVKEEFMKNVEDYGSMVLSLLNLYKDLGNDNNNNDSISGHLESM